MIGFHAFDLAIGDEDHAIDAFENKFSAGVVEDLAGHGVQMKSRSKAADFPEGEREKIEEEGAFGFGGEGDHAPFHFRAGLIVNVLQIACFTAEAGTVVDDLAIDFS